MTEERVGLLYKLASQLSDIPSNPTAASLRGFYLIRCHDLTRSYGLPTQQFSPSFRCSFCCQEWKQGTYETKISPTKLSKKQRRKLRSYKVTENNKDKVKSKGDLLHSNQLERRCLICKHTTTISMPKPAKIETKKRSIENKDRKLHERETSTAKCIKEMASPKLETMKTTEVNVYNTTKEIFSLNNKDNVLKSTVKDKPKVINNNKRKKDKFAGLCKEAVLASAKLVQQKSSKNKLDLFLKPSS